MTDNANGRPLRVLFVVPSFPNVTETFIAAQIRGLMRRGHAVQVFAMERGSGRIPEDVACRVAAAPRGGSLASWTMLVRALVSRRLRIPGLVRSLRFGRQGLLAVLRAGQEPLGAFDIIHAHFGPGGIQAAALRAAGLVTGRLVVTFHGHDVSAYVRQHGAAVYRRLFETADLCLPVTDNWKRALLALGCPPRKVRTHRMGVDLHEFTPKPSARHDVPVILAVARLVEKKGIEYAVRAVAALRPHVDVKLVVVGDGPLRAPLEALIAELGAADRVELAGWRNHDEVRRAFAAADIALLPSVTAQDGDQEGLPVSIMEAMAAGLPVIATTHSGIPELVRDGVEGILVPERNADAIGAAIRTLIDDPALRHALGTAARRRVAELHDQNLLDAELEAHYRSLLASRRGEPAIAGANA